MWDEEHDRDRFPWASVIRSEMETWQPEPRRLELCDQRRVTRGVRDRRVATILVGGLVLLLNVAVVSGGMDPRQWWATAWTAVRQVVQPAGQSGQGRGAGPPANLRVGAGHDPPDAGGGSPGVVITGNLRGEGGLTGSIGGGLVHLSGTLDGGGTQGSGAPIAEDPLRYRPG